MGNRAGTLHMPSIPTFTDPVLEREWALEHMAGAFRLFGKFSFGEGAAGHISLRDPVNPDWMWINPFGMHFSQIKKSDSSAQNASSHLLLYLPSVRTGHVLSIVSRK